MTHDGRESYDRLVLFRLDALGTDLQRVEDKVEAILIDVAMLKVKSAVWGATAAMIPAGVAIALSLVMGS